MNKNLPVLVIAAIVLFLVWLDYRVWSWALSPHYTSSTLSVETADLHFHEYVFDGVRRLRAYRVETTLPNYMGSRGFSATGFNEAGEVIWSVNSVERMERVR